MAERAPPTQRFRIRRGLDVVLRGAPEQLIGAASGVSSVAVLGADYPGLRPTLLVAVGDRVRAGQALAADRSCAELRITAPGAGVVTEIERGGRRSLRAIVVALEGDEAETFPHRPASELRGLARGAVIDVLLASGLWSALRTRPFHRIPAPGESPHSLFVTAIATDPLAARPEVVLAERPGAFEAGLTVLSHLTDGPVHVCKRTGADVPVGDAPRVTVSEFDGPHPAGLVGTHIHHLDPVGPAKTVWHVGYQDVLAAGGLFTTGRLPVERVVSLAGPLVARPRLVRTRLGANVNDLVAGEIVDRRCRVISGSVLSGRQASGWGRHLGRHHQQVCVLPEPGAQSDRAGRGALTTALHGRRGPLLATVDFDRVMPLDLLATPLLRALVVGDTERARDLGCLELDEEDLALCTYVCPAKLEYGPLLSRALAVIARQG